jgi:hypothetical protein
MSPAIASSRSSRVTTPLEYASRVDDHGHLGGLALEKADGVEHRCIVAHRKRWPQHALQIDGHAVQALGEHLLLAHEADDALDPVAAHGKFAVRTRAQPLQASAGSAADVEPRYVGCAAS